MSEPEMLGVYIRLGWLLRWLYYPHDRQFKDVFNETTELLHITQRLGFEVMALRISLFLVKIKEDYEKDKTVFRSGEFSTSEGLPNNHLITISELINDYHRFLQDNVSGLEAITIERNVVSHSLRDLAAKDNNIVLAETIVCLECKAFRSAIVMGWNYAFDHLRQWIFASPRKRLKVQH